MKTILIQPPDPQNKQIIRDHMGRFGIVKSKLSVFRDDILPPLDLAYSASLLENNGFDVNIIDASALSLNSQKVLKMVEKENPDMIVVGTSGAAIESDLEFARELKRITEAIVSVSGPYVTLDPNFALKENGIDTVIHGEIEYTILKLAETFPDFIRVKGLTYKKNEKIIQTPKRELIKNLDELPLPAYHLLPMKKYSYKLIKKKPFTTVLSSRGCPFCCIYCPYPIGYGNVWRGRSPENVISELKMLSHVYNIRSILFRDQVFTFDNKRTEKICDGIKREGLDLEWRCETRVDRLNKALMSKMRDAGCSGIHLGVESGDPQILKRHAKAGTSLEQVKRIFKEAKKLGLETVAFFMLGLPDETKESIKRTLKFAKELNSDITWFTAAVPYPGTKLYDIAEKNGWILSNDLGRYSGREVVMRNDSLSEDDLKKALITAKIMFSKGFFENVRKLLTLDGILCSFLGSDYVLRKIWNEGD